MWPSALATVEWKSYSRFTSKIDVDPDLRGLTDALFFSLFLSSGGCDRGRASTIHADSALLSRTTAPHCRDDDQANQVSLRGCGKVDLLSTRQPPIERFTNPPGLLRLCLARLNQHNLIQNKNHSLPLVLALCSHPLSSRMGSSWPRYRHQMQVPVATGPSTTLPLKMHIKASSSRCPLQNNFFTLHARPTTISSVPCASWRMLPTRAVTALAV